MQLSGARKLEISVDSPGGTTYDPASGVHPSLVYGSILTRSRMIADRLIAN